MAKRFDRLLIVDDNEDNRFVLAQRLRREGFECVSVASDGRQALRKLRDPDEKPYDLMLLDIMMPNMNGYEVLEELKAEGRLESLPIIMISAVADMDSILKCVKLGARDYIVKPFNPSLLMNRVDACLQKADFERRTSDYEARLAAAEDRAKAAGSGHRAPPAARVRAAVPPATPAANVPAAVLVSELIGFEDFVERESPDQVSATLDRIAAAFRDAAREEELDTVKIVGETFMATAGLVEVSAAPVEACTRAALRFADLLSETEEGWVARSAVHFGPVPASLGRRREQLLDVGGRTVISATRIKDSIPSEGISLSRPAWKQVEAIWPFEPRAHVSLRDGETIPVFGLVAPDRQPRTDDERPSVAADAA